MNAAYLVVGESGEYSDHQMWFYSVHLDKEEAERVATILREACPPIEEWWDDFSGQNYSELDPQASPSYTGVEYSVAEVPLGVAEQIRPPLTPRPPPPPPKPPR